MAKTSNFSVGKTFDRKFLVPEASLHAELGCALVRASPDFKWPVDRDLDQIPLKAHHVQGLPVRKA